MPPAPVKRQISWFVYCDYETHLEPTGRILFDDDRPPVRGMTVRLPSDGEDWVVSWVNENSMAIVLTQQICIVCGDPEPCSHDFDNMGVVPTRRRRRNVWLEDEVCISGRELAAASGTALLVILLIGLLIFAGWKIQQNL